MVSVVNITCRLHMLTDVLGFNVGMDQVTLVMKVLESKKDLLCNDLDEGLGDTFLLIALNQRE